MNSRGPRRDLALLRKLKNAKDGNFNPSALLQEGSNLLDKASKLQKFVKQQKQRTGTSNAKTEWILTWRELQAERDAAEKELALAIMGLQESADVKIHAEATDALAQWQATVEECTVLKQELHAHVLGIGKVHASFKLYGPGEFREEATALRKEIKMVKEDLQLQLAQLATALDELTAEVQAVWPSAVAGGAAPSNPDDTPTQSMARPPSIIGRSSGSNSGSCGLGPGRRPSSQGEQPDISPQHQLSTQGVSGLETDASGLETDASGLEIAGVEAEEMTPQTSSYETSAPLSFLSGGPQGVRSKEWEELERLLARFPVVGGATKGRVRDVYEALEGQFLDKMVAWQAEAEAGGPQLLASPTGGWPQDHHSMFVSLREKYWREMAPKGASREALMRKLAALMPRYSLQALLAHDSWHTTYKLIQRKRKDLVDSWVRDRRQFLVDTEALLKEATDIEVGHAEAAAARLAHELVRERAKGDLQGQVVVAAAKAEVEAQARALAEAEAAQRRAEEEAVFQEERAAKKELIAAYRLELERRQAEEQAALRAAAEAEAAEKAAQAAYNRDRVDWRKAELTYKADKAAEARAVAAAAAAAREERLERLRALVAPVVEADPLRVLLPTEASSAVDELRAATKEGAAFHSVHGFTNAQVYKDERFKVMEALQKAGLHTTDYGRMVIAQAHTATATRRDNLTTLQRSQKGVGAGTGSILF